MSSCLISLIAFSFLQNCYKSISLCTVSSSIMTFMVCILEQLTGYFASSKMALKTIILDMLLFGIYFSFAVWVVDGLFNCTFIELLITYAINILKKHHCYPLQGVPEHSNCHRMSWCRQASCALKLPWPGTRGTPAGNSIDRQNFWTIIFNDR